MEFLITRLAAIKISSNYLSDKIWRQDCVVTVVKEKSNTRDLQVQPVPWISDNTPFKHFAYRIWAIGTFLIDSVQLVLTLTVCIKYFQKKCATCISQLFYCIVIVPGRVKLFERFYGSTSRCEFIFSRINMYSQSK